MENATFDVLAVDGLVGLPWHGALRPGRAGRLRERAFGNWMTAGVRAGRGVALPRPAPPPSVPLDASIEHMFLFVKMRDGGNGKERSDDAGGTWWAAGAGGVGGARGG